MPRYLITAAGLIDAVADAPILNPILEVEADRILSVSSGEPPSEPDCPIVRLDNAFLIPGLIDAHVHLCLNERHDARAIHLQDSDELTLLRALGNSQKQLEAGVTTVRDCGGRGDTITEVSKAIEAAAVRGARVLACGSPVCPPRGHLWFMGGEVATEAELIDSIRRKIDSGAHFIKLMSTGGNFTPGTDITKPGLDLSSMQTAVDTAHGRSVHAAAHAHGAQGISNSLIAGVDTIEHCTFATRDGVRIDDDLVDRIAASDTFVVPTMAAAVRRARARDPSRSNDFAPGSTKFNDVKSMLAAGVKMIAATDAGPPEHYHGGVAEEIGFLAEAGMRPMAAIRAATAVSAKVLRRSDSIGQIAPGKIADIIALARDPLKDLTALTEIELVIKDGRPLAGRLLAQIAATGLYENSGM